MEKGEIKIGLVDDHSLFRKGVANLLNKIPEFNVILEAGSGEEFLDQLEKVQEPDVCVVDIKMKTISGYEVVERLSEKYPKIKCLALSMYNDDVAIIKMLKAGAKGYLLKGAEPWELQQAIKTTYLKGYYNGDAVNEALLNQFHTNGKNELKDYEIKFLEHCCTEDTYKEIANKMEVSPRTVDGYRDRLFDKLEVNSRVGLVLYSIKNGLVKLN